MKWVYYPKCKKPIEPIESNLPFANVTLGNVLDKMEPKHDLYFRYLLGYGPYDADVGDSVNTEAVEVIINYRVILIVGMTFLKGVHHDFTN